MGGKEERKRGKMRCEVEEKRSKDHDTKRRLEG